MAINLSATEAVDLVCNDVFDCECEREGVQELYSYHRGTTVGSEHTCSYVEDDMELEIPGKKNSYLRSIFEEKSKK